jgi:uncharacterized protein (TIGR02001 family)
VRRAALTRSTLVRHAMWAGSLLVSGAAHAQFGGGIAIESDNRFRGVSLTDGQPDLRLSLSYDHDSGVFAGAAATRVEFMRGRHALQLLGYAGYVARVTPEFGAEVGVTSSTFGGNTRYDYSEIFAGISNERWSLRMYYAPRYFGFDQATVYLEFGANTVLTPRLRAFGHIGALRTLGGIEGEGGRRTRADLRVGLGFSAAAAVDVQLAWVTATRGGPYVVEYGTRRSSFVLSAQASF